MRALSVALAALICTTGCKKKEEPLPPVAEPELTMDASEMWQRDGVALRGRAVSMTSVSVNGEPATLAGSDWTANLSLERGVTVIEATGIDVRGDPHVRRQGVIAGEFRDPDATVDGAIAFRINQSGLDKLGDSVGGLVVAADLLTTVAAANPIYSGSFVFDTVTVDASLVGLQFDPLQVGTNPQDGFLEMDIEIPNLQVDINAVGSAIGIGFDQDLAVWADGAVITGVVQADVTVDGQLQLELMDPVVELQGFGYDLSLLPSVIEGSLFIDTIREAIEETLVEQIQAQVPALLEDTLGGLDFSFQTELLGKNVAVGATFADLYSDAQGLQLEANLDVLADKNDGYEYPGFLAATGGRPANPSRVDDMGISLSDDLLNNLLLQAWRAGVLDVDLDSAEGELQPIFLSSLGATDAARVITKAALPPIMVERNGRPQAQITEMLVEIQTPGGDNGEVLNLAVTAFVDLELVVEDSVLKIELGTPEIILDVRSSDWGISDNSLTNLIASELPIDTLLSLLGGFEFPLPSLGDLSVKSALAERDESGQHTSIGASL